MCSVCGLDVGTDGVIPVMGVGTDRYGLVRMGGTPKLLLVWVVVVVL